jgi:UDP-N-acetylmuramoylalanine--D-glutamate ligase
MGEGISLPGAHITVLGAGRTGRATAEFLAQRGANVLLSDRSPLPASLKRDLASWGIDLEEGHHTERVFQADLIITSPGIPYEALVLMEARRQGIPILSELELAYRFCKSAHIIAITGTVGKTTTTHLIAELLRAHGRRVVVAGNIGEPFIAKIPEIDEEAIVVLEVSSYQLEHVETLRPRVAVFTKFAPHHLDRHGTLERYFELKCRLFAGQTERDVAVVHEDVNLPDWVRSRVITFSSQDMSDQTVGDDLPTHQRENLAAALNAARAIDPRVSLHGMNIGGALRLPHRLEYVTEIDGVRFYNDSKATSPTATLAALAAFEEPLVWIAGGYDRGEDPAPLIQAVCTRDVRAIFLVGQTRVEWARALSRAGYQHFRVVSDLSQAIAGALRLRPRVCLFSPAAPSFDEYRNYEERGERFKEAVSVQQSAKGLAVSSITRLSDQVATVP